MTPQRFSLRYRELFAAMAALFAAVIFFSLFPLHAHAGFQVDTNGTLTTNLVAYWKLNENATGTRADSYGTSTLSDFGGVATGTSIGISSPNIAADFGASNSSKYLEIGSNLGISGIHAMSMCGWAKSETGNGNPARILYLSSPTPNDIDTDIRAEGPTTDVDFQRSGSSNDPITKVMMRQHCVPLSSDSWLTARLPPALAGRQVIYLANVIVLRL